MTDPIDDGYDAATSAFLATFRAYVTENYGERCPDKEDGCACCELWAQYDAVKARVLFEDIT